MKSENSTGVDGDDAMLDLITETCPLTDITAAVRSATPEWDVTSLIWKAVAAAVAQKDAEIARKDLSLNLVSEILRKDRDEARQRSRDFWDLLKKAARERLVRRPTGRETS